ncbi:hypothetical protein [Massilia sp. CCM 8734]|uniref:hypothetical protein n=1 Tax=Massilia sp. CCM 8734 TaxID=2609283 RepID=UPI001422C78D|nr:hypothetical protein [Massilia sp. CCM 8734]NHZ94614.1 hypothetical protein [Massilia sp. CCM 8734]
MNSLLLLSMIYLIREARKKAPACGANGWLNEIAVNVHHSLKVIVGYHNPNFLPGSRRNFDDDVSNSRASIVAKEGFDYFFA